MLFDTGVVLTGNFSGPHSHLFLTTCTITKWHLGCQIAKKGAEELSSEAIIQHLRSEIRTDPKLKDYVM